MKNDNIYAYIYIMIRYTVVAILLVSLVFAFTVISPMHKESLCMLGNTNIHLGEANCNQKKGTWTNWDVQPNW
jgi:hypothetical protein